MSENAVETAGELLRRRAKKKQSPFDDDNSLSDHNEHKSHVSKPSADLDDEIKRLEAELAEDNADSSSNDDDDDDDDDDESSSENAKETNDAKQGVVRLSSLDKDRIESLPTYMLPTARKRSLQNTDNERPKKNEKVDSGLTLAVKEVLSGYVARSAERLPFYCRVCQKQYTNEQEFFAHKQSDFHITAVEVERKASYCKLCRKQLTSPEQLKEHLSSRPHKERLERARSKNPPGRGNRGRGRGLGFGGRGRGRDTRTNWAR